MDAELRPRTAEAGDVGGEEVDDEDCTKQMATGEDGNRDAADVGPDEEAAEVAVLREVKAVGDLPERAGKNEDHREAKTGDGETKRGGDAKSVTEDVRHRFRDRLLGESSR